jgi:multidrug efflux pump subunit AcrA (membrane-fusion protein)
MAATLAAYNAYVTKMNELFKTLVGANLLDPNVVNTINNILAELQTLSAKVKTSSNDFLANNTKVVTGTFNPTILATPKTIATEVQNNVNAAQTAEQQRLAGEKAAADQAAAAAAAEAARREAERVAAEQASQQGPHCPVCGASDPAVWVEMRGSYKCYNCGYRQEKQ